jgi:hypothetical protein
MNEIKTIRIDDTDAHDTVDDRFGSIHISKHDEDHINVVVYTNIGGSYSECKEYLLSRDNLKVLLAFIKEK